MEELEPRRKKKQYRKVVKNEGVSVFLRHVKCGECRAMFFTDKAKAEHRRIFHSVYWQDSFKTHRRIG